MDTHTSGHDLIVIGASAGGIQAMQTLLRSLPPSLPAMVLLAIHLAAESRSQMPLLFGRESNLPVNWAEDGEPLVHGQVRIAPPDHHLLVERQALRVVKGPRENRHRPAIDPLFRSAAWSHGPRVVGVVLSGYLDDGTAGLWAIKSCGGITVVQDPDDALQPDMPANALMHNRIDHRLGIEQIGPLLAELATRPAPGQPPSPGQPQERIGLEVGFAAMDRNLDDAPRLGALSPFTCPTCRGALWEMDEGGHLRYRCHTGHAFSHSSLLIEQTEELENSVYAALRVVEEKAAALRRLAERWTGRFPQVTDDYTERARQLDRTASTLRALLAGEPLRAEGAASGAGLAP
jgi:two-component system, chemotaxis family, protein-glutamate methylesterase/glutaminase